VTTEDHSIPSVEIEDAVAAHPAVADVAAYAVPADEAEDEVMITALKSVG
jgi:acyl-CoA synthetase (AMP-forming)/AMP-acid ligase II